LEFCMDVWFRECEYAYFSLFAIVYTKLKIPMFAW